MPDVLTNLVFTRNEDEAIRLIRNACFTENPTATPAGMNIVSPQWVLRSAAASSLQRVLTISMDASKQLPPSCSAGAVGAGVACAAAGEAGVPAAVLAVVPAGRCAREALVQSLALHGERDSPAFREIWDVSEHIILTSRFNSPSS